MKNRKFKYITGRDLIYTLIKLLYLIYLNYLLAYSVCNHKTVKLKSQNYTVYYADKNIRQRFGIIRNFYKIENKIYCLIQKLEKSKTFVNNQSLENIVAEFFAICSLTSNYDIIKFESILKKCVILNKENLIFLSICNDLSETK